MSSGRSNRGARAIVCVIVCMVIATTIMMTTMRTAIRMRRQMRTETQMEQTRWMLRAAAHRATAKLSGNADYAGEKWDVSNALDSYDNAAVEIQVETTRDGQKIVSATSGIGAAGNPIASTRRSGRWRIELKQSEQNE
jgi:type II secretory pathway component PulK